MSYQNVATPRFYIDYLSYFQAKGWIVRHLWHDVPQDEYYTEPQYTVSLNPAKFSEYVFLDNSYFIKVMADIYPNTLQYRNYNFNFGMLLNHNTHNIGDSTVCHFIIREQGSDETLEANRMTNANVVIGASESGDFFTPEQNITIITFDDLAVDDSNKYFDGISWVLRHVNTNEGFHEWNGTENSIKIGTWTIGRYFDMPFSPDLSLKLNHEFGGIEQTETRGGATLTNANWISPPKWGDQLEAWQLSNQPDFHYSGRRVWDLSWSYVSSSDLEPENYGILPQTLTGKSNFFSEVLHKTMGYLPFVFCPDASINYAVDETTGVVTTPEFAVCRFDMDSFERTQVANNVYNISLKIRECW